MAVPEMWKERSKLSEENQGKDAIQKMKVEEFPEHARGVEFYDRLYGKHEGKVTGYINRHHSWVFVVLEAMMKKEVSQTSRILEAGCGPGWLANYLHDRGWHNYQGFDLSPVAVDLARRRGLRGFGFYPGDFHDPKSFEGQRYDIVVSAETLEHLKDDIGAIGNIEKGKWIVASVPSVMYGSHVRIFQTSDEVINHYKSVIKIKDWMFVRKSFVFIGRRI